MDSDLYRYLMKGKLQLADMDDEVIQPHVLIVDDEPMFRLIHSSMFTKHSCRVTIAENGFHAMELLGLGHANKGLRTDTISNVSMIFTSDLMPPGMSGFELLRRIKESPITKNVPVVLLSNYPDPERMKKYLDDGAVMYLIKPLKSSTVENLVKLMGNKRRL